METSDLASDALLARLNAELVERETKAKRLQEQAADFLADAASLRRTIGLLTADEGATEPQGRRRSRRVPGGTVGILKELLPGQAEWTLDEVIEALKIDGRLGDSPPNRMSVVNRLSDLIGEGFLERAGRGRYKLADTDGAPPTQASLEDRQPE